VRRVPAGTKTYSVILEEKLTLCLSCSNRGIFIGNKYGQYLAAIQVAREERRRRREEAEAHGTDAYETTAVDEDAASAVNSADEDDNAPVGFADGRAHRAESSVWADT